MNLFLRKRKISIILLLLLLTACSNGDANSKEQDITETQVITDSNLINETKSLTISTYNDDLGLNNIMKTFSKPLNDVEVIINVIEREKYDSQLSVAIMSGTASDIFVTDDYNQFSDRGLLVDFNKLMNDDTSFDKTQYISNVFKAMEYKGGMYAFPITVENYGLVAINNSISTEDMDGFIKLKSISTMELINYYNNMNEQNEMNVEEHYSSFDGLSSVYPDYIDIEKKTCDFNNQDFINSMKLFKVVNIPDIEVNMPGTMNNFQSDLEKSQKYIFNEIFFNGIQYFLPFEDSNFTHCIPITDKNDNVIIDTSNYSINAGSKNIETAWEFMKYMVSTDVQINLYQNRWFIRPVNKEAFQYVMKDFTEDFIEGSNYINHYITGDETEAVNNVISAFDKINEMPMKLSFNNSDITTIIYDEYDEYLKGITTAEQAAANIQNKIQLKLVE